MPRATANFTVRHPITKPVELGCEYDGELSTMLGRCELPDRFKPRLEHLIGTCRQHILRKVPLETERVLVLDAIEKHLLAVVHLLGQPGDAVAGPLASLRRELPGGLSELRDFQSHAESVMAAAEKARRTPLEMDLNMSHRSAKESMAAGIVGLLHDCDIRATTTLEPRSSYLQLVEFALLHVDPKRPGDAKGIAAKGLKAWRDQSGC